MLVLVPQMIVEPPCVSSGWHQHNTATFGDTFGYPLVKTSAIGWIAPPPAGPVFAGVVVPWKRKCISDVETSTLRILFRCTHIEGKVKLAVELVEQRLGCFPILALRWLGVGSGYHPQQSVL